VVSDSRIRVARTETHATPIPVQPGEITTEQLSYRAIDAPVIATQAITSQKFAASAWTPHGDGLQRVPAPMTDLEYWSDVVTGDIELHREGVHADEDTVNVEATSTGVLMTPTETEESRLFLTGRFRRPDSSTLFVSGTCDRVVTPGVIDYFEAYGITATPYTVAVATPEYFSGAPLPTEGDQVVVSGTTYGLSVTASAGAMGFYYSSGGKVTVNLALNPSLSIGVTYPLLVGDTVTVTSGGALATVLPAGATTVSAVAPDNSWFILNVPVAPGVPSGYLEGNMTLQLTGVFDGTYTVLPFAASPTPHFVIDTKRRSNGSFSSSVSSGIDYLSASVSQSGGVYSEVPGSMPGKSVRVVWWATDTLDTKHRYLYPTMGKQLELTSPAYEASYLDVSDALDGLSSVATLSLTALHDIRVGELVNVSGTSGTGLTSPYDGQVTITEVGDYTISWVVPLVTGFGTSLLADDGVTYVGRASLEVYDYSVYVELPASSPSLLLTRMDVFEVVGHTTANGGSARVSPNGIELVGSGEAGSQSVALSLTTDGNTIMRVQATDAYGVTQDNAAIYSDGTGSFELLKTDTDLNVSGTDLGREYDNAGNELVSRSFYSAKRNNTAYDGSWLNRLARGVVYCGNWKVPGTLAVPASSASPWLLYVISTGSFLLEDQRSYRIMANLAGLRQSTAPANPTYYTLRFSLTEPAANAYPTSYSMSSYMAASSTATIPDISGQFQADSTVTSVDGKVIVGTVTAVTAASGTVTYTVGSGHQFQPGMRITVTGVNPTAYNLTNVTVASVTATQIRVTNAATGTYVSGGTVTGYDARYLPAGIRIYWALMIHATAATATFNLAGTNLTGGQSNLNVTVEDVGQAIQSEASYVGALASATPGSTIITATKTITATESGYWDNYGRGDNGTGDPYANEYSIYHGNPGTASGTKKSAIEFPTLGLPSGATITGMRLYLKNRLTYDGSLKAYVGAHNFAELGSTLPSPVTSCAITSRTYSSGEGAWITLPSSWYSVFAAGNAKGVLLGLTGFTTYESTKSNYGYFDGVGTGMTAPPKLEITYQYTA
jgi:hypothetical protein